MGWLDSLEAAANKDTSKLEEDERRKIAADLVKVSSFGAAAVTYVPVPLSDFLLVTPVQASMVMTVGRVYGRKLDSAGAKQLLVELGAVCGVGLVAQKGFATLSKLLLPGLGGLIAGPYAFGVTYGLGHVAMRYFETRGHSRAALKQVFEDAVAEAKRIFSTEKLEEFRKERGAEVEEFARGAAGGKKKAGAPKKKRPAPRRPASSAPSKRPRSRRAPR